MRASIWRKHDSRRKSRRILIWKMCHGRANMNQISFLAFFLIEYDIFSLILKLQRLNLLSNFPEKPLKIPEKEKEKKTVRGMWLNLNWRRVTDRLKDWIECKKKVVGGGGGRWREVVVQCRCFSGHLPSNRAVVDEQQPGDGVPRMQMWTERPNAQRQIPRYGGSIFIWTMRGGYLASHGGGDYKMMEMMVRRWKWCSLDASLQK